MSFSMPGSESEHICYRKGELHCEGASLRAIAADHGTPTYVYSQAALLERARAFLDAAPESGLVCFAVKANGNPHLLQLLADAGMGADVTSGGELFLALHAGFDPRRILYSGVGKSAAEMRQALEADVRAIHVESEQEFALLGELATAHRRVAGITVRFNPDIPADTHAHLSTGERAHKFGVPAETALRLLQEADRHPWMRPLGLAVHIGSQVRKLAPFERAAEKLVELAGSFIDSGGRLEYLDIGGGLGVSYDGSPVPEPAAWVQSVADTVARTGLQLVLEPGRSIVAPVGLLLTRVLYVKEQGGRRFIVVDAGMNSLLRPALYGAIHPIVPVTEKADAPLEVADVVGPICESGDYLLRDHPLPSFAPGALLAVLQVGAYGFAMSSNYNGQLRPAEILVTGGLPRVIREREGYETLLRGT